jgi:hypothetical protein
MPLLLTAIAVLSPSFALAADTPDYLKDIKPILKNRCSNCHGSLKQKADLRLDAGKLIHLGADGLPVIVPGNPDDSELIIRILSQDEDERMPAEGKPLSARQVEQLRNWITAGASYPENEEIPVRPADHWAFQSVVRSSVPKVKGKRWPRNEIDFFILSRLEQQNLAPNPDASPARLLRRTHLDLVGLPPTLAEQDAYEKAHTPKDYLALIDNLLDRPGYGERYGRHWLDVVRYADSNGYERDAEKPEVWRYRDYVIRSLNADKPFDRFLAEQLAGDELEDATTDSVIATGFNRLGPWDDEPANFAVDRFDQLDDIVNTTSQAFIGLTMGCARCHDHKFDPLTQKEYYNMVAVFNPLIRPQNGRTELTRYAVPPLERKKLEAWEKAIADENAAKDLIYYEFASEFLRQGKSELPADVQLAYLIFPEDRNGMEKGLVRRNQDKLDKEISSVLPDSLRKKIETHDERIAFLEEENPDEIRGYFLVEDSPVPPETRLLKRGNPNTPGDIVEPAVPAILTESQPVFDSNSAHTTERRKNLANWLTQPNNPLTARVIVNRVWQWHFGNGLVRTPNDFGLTGAKPTHPELLDWLAHWFVHDARWSLKKLHRLIMTSRAYQMSREVVPRFFEADSENLLLWRQSYRRLEVEVIRDSMLFVSGKLDRKMFGPAMYPFVPQEALLNHADKTSIWPEFDEDNASRRTVYAFVKRSLVVPLLEVLDLCDTVQSAPQRKVTTVPTQALTLYNGNFVQRQSAHFAHRLIREAGPDPDDQIRLAWRLALGRLPSTAEFNGARTFYEDELNEQQLLHTATSPEERSSFTLTQLCRVIFNLNEFVYTD